MQKETGRAKQEQDCLFFIDESEMKSENNKSTLNSRLSDSSSYFEGMMDVYMSHKVNQTHVKLQQKAYRTHTHIRCLKSFPFTNQKMDIYSSISGLSLTRQLEKANVHLCEHSV